MKVYSSSGSAGFKLAPDLNYPDNVSANDGHITVIGSNAASSYKTVLSLSGKWVIDLLYFYNLKAERVDIKLTIDGVIIWDSGQSIPSTTLKLIGNIGTANTRQPFICEESLLLEVKTTTNYLFNLSYSARPIL